MTDKPDLPRRRRRRGVLARILPADEPSEDDADRPPWWGGRDWWRQKYNGTVTAFIGAQGRDPELMRDGLADLRIPEPTNAPEQSDAAESGSSENLAWLHNLQRSLDKLQTELAILRTVANTPEEQMSWHPRLNLLSPMLNTARSASKHAYHGLHRREAWASTVNDINGRLAELETACAEPAVRTAGMAPALSVAEQLRSLLTKAAEYVPGAADTAEVDEE